MVVSLAKKKQLCLSTGEVTEDGEVSCNREGTTSCQIAIAYYSDVVLERKELASLVQRVIAEMGYIQGERKKDNILLSKGIIELQDLVDFLERGKIRERVEVKK